ncbi:hypothetical protein JCM14076_18280 [Methylosoma difficile]
MSIRFTLLISYLLISLASALLITLMIYAHFRDILWQEINNKLQSQATTIMQQIDTGLFERLENMSMWSNLEIMQEIHVGDVDKRLANYISELQHGYGGIYGQIFVTDPQGNIIAATDKGVIGHHYTQQAPWLVVKHKNISHALLPLDKPNQQLIFTTAIPDAFNTGELGRLYTGFDWHEIDRLLDTPLPYSSKNSPTYALLVDADGQVIATSSILRDKPVQFSRLPELLKKMDAAETPVTINVDFINDEEVLVGYAKGQGYRTFAGLGWRVLILQPSQSALLPVWNLWSAILMYLGLTLLLGVLVSLWMSSQIAKPIVRLAEFTRDFTRGKSNFPPHAKTSREITELNIQFLLMINHLEQSRQDLVRVAKLAVIGEMAASMAHEVRTPLGILRSSAQILEREPNLSEIGVEMTSYILSETQRLNDLITTLLACAKPRPPHFVSHDLHDIIAHTLELLQSQADSRQVRLSTHLIAEPSQLDCDRDHLIQVLLNLVMNAIQHVHAGGNVQVSSANSGQSLEICVNDDGAGIADADKSKVFEPFFTQRKDGIGLGLTVVQQIVQAHQGLVFVADSPLGGASFHVVLPIVQKES